MIRALKRSFTQDPVFSAHGVQQTHRVDGGDQKDNRHAAKGRHQGESDTAARITNLSVFYNLRCCWHTSSLSKVGGGGNPARRLGRVGVLLAQLGSWLPGRRL